MLVTTHQLILLALLSLISSTTTLADNVYQPKDHIFINFKPTKTSNDGTNTWHSDQNYILAQPSTTTNYTNATSVGAEDIPYDTARIFWTEVKYSVPVSSSGPKLIRLHFPPLSTSYTNIDINQAYLTLNLNGFEIVRNFSAYLVTNFYANSNTTMVLVNGGLMKEIYFDDSQVSKTLNFTFKPSNPGGFGFINGIEIISAPSGLYANQSSDIKIPYLKGDLQDYVNFEYDFSRSLVMENVIRLNVGGSTILPDNDTGIGRIWYSDQNFVRYYSGFGSFTTQTTFNISNGDDIHYTVLTPNYTAPADVYSTLRMLGPYSQEIKTKLNLTLDFNVDGGFNYLVRLHFCEIDRNVTTTGERVFNVYINDQMALDLFDVFYVAGGRQIPIYRDFVVRVNNNGSDGIISALSVALTPSSQSIYDDVLLNGLEIFKLNSSSDSLAAPNPTLPQSMLVNEPTPSKKSSNHHKLAIIIGVIVGVILVSLLFVCFIIICTRKKAKQRKIIKEDSKMSWVSPFNDTSSNATMISVGSSLPSDLCRRFTFVQIKVATNNFDENLVVGTGGFGKVYKGYIDDGATSVAVKRLNTTSKQGAREFQTEIEMLSRLRHINLVSLIGYCEDHNEMILVYEYMPHGTLRDHLLYKNPEKNNVAPLPWKQRLKICVGSAEGLHYLHAGAKELIIHRDVKSTNILLDDNWTAKVSDFGLSKMGAVAGEGGATHVSTAVKGSFGYLDPEYYRRQQLTEKSDVYSFGVLLFEVLCARPAMNPNLPKEQVNLALWARSRYKIGILHSIVDPNIRDQIAPECLRKFGEIAETCTRDRGTERPSMGDIVWGLEFAFQLQETAEKNNVTVDNEGNLSTHTSFNNHEIGNSGSYNDVEVYSTTSGDKFSETSVKDSDKKGLLDSTTISVSSSDYPIDNTKSVSVFSEIIDPKAR